MEDSTIFRIEKPRRLKIMPSKRGYEDYDIVGLDVETIERNGRNELYSVQLFSDTKAIFEMGVAERFPDEIDRFNYLMSLLDLKKPTFIFAHNLSFDLGNLFPKKIIKLTALDINERENFGTKGESMKIAYPSPTFLMARKLVRKGKMGKEGEYANIGFTNVYFVDTMKFFPMSLSRASEKFNLPVKKLERPEYLGKREPTKEEFPYFKEYSMIDAVVVYYLGRLFLEYHKKYDINPQGTISPATLASSVFLGHFLKTDIEFMRSKPALYMALASYWGGRTEAFCGGTTNLKVYDYNSFYPYAMTKIFLPTDKNGWKKTKQIKSPFGFYRIRGELEEGEHKVSPVPYKKGRLMFPVGKFDRIMTGFEAEEVAKHCKEYDVVRGYYYDGKQDYSLVDYVHEFYEQKKQIDKDKNPSEYNLTKLLLNSLYGKFIQLVRGGIRTFYINDCGDRVDWGKRFQAGGLFSPAVASWITGFCRAKLFSDMKRKEEHVVYCDTDSIGLRKGTLPESDKLGGLKVEASGTGTIIREKLYFVVDGDDNIVKSGTHAFLGRKEQLKEMVEKGVSDYQVDRMIQLKEAFRQGRNPFVWVNQPRSISLHTSQKRENSRSLDFINDFVWLNPIKVHDF